MSDLSIVRSVAIHRVLVFFYLLVSFEEGEMPHGLVPPANITVAPRIWVLMGNKAGDNSQVLALAEALGWPFEIKRFVYRTHKIVPNLLLRTTLSGIDRRQSSPIEAPWPDLVISAGRRNEPVARWIKQQSPDTIRLVRVGRPWSSLDRFDLVVTTPQYRLPVVPNVLHNKTPLHRVTKERLARETARWRDRFAHLPRPFTAVIVGGSSGPHSFDHRAADRLATEASAFVAEQGGSLLITTSARTPPPTIETLEQNLRVPAHLFRWSKEAKENPYFAFLGLADSIIVTGDSMSMLAEACATRKPVYIFDLCERKGAMCSQMAGAAMAAHHLRVRRRRLEWAHIGAFLYRLLMKFGPERLSRDIRIIHNYLIDSGRAVWLGERFDPARPLPVLDCVERAVVRVRALMQATPALSVAAHASLDELMPLRRSV
jgi:mitochondrial fission protein ELM1